MFEFLKRKEKKKSPTLVSCDFCPVNFKQGTGHRCWCVECTEVHPMCNKCYTEARTLGNINDKIADITQENKDRYT